jgi:hypothetical protein
MSQHLQYLRYVLRHKWFVFLAGFDLCVPIWRLIVHDWTKFQPVEWFPYVRFFYGNGRSREQLGSYSADQVQDGDFELAWNHHQKRNDHHWQYWIRFGDDGTVLTIPMPDVCRREMLADWRGAGRALGKTDTPAWYEANKEKLQLHPETRAWVEVQLKEQSELERLDRMFKAGFFG